MRDLKVATWNIRKCIGLDRRRDPHRTARVISSLAADVVVLQEADKRLGRRPAALRPELIASETGMTAVDAGGHEPSIGWHGNAVLVSNRITVDDVHQVHLPGIEPRGALVVDLFAGSQPLRIVAVHLGFLRRMRRAQLATIRARLDALDHRATAILGDFNEWSPTTGLEPLVGYHIHTPGNTFHAARPVAPLDRIAVSNSVTLSDPLIVSNRLTRVASDHLPVKATLTLETV